MKTAILSPFFYYVISSGINNLGRVSHHLSPEELTERFMEKLLSSP